jgi:hypothetical protein
MDRAIASLLNALADDCERRADKLRSRCKALLDPLRALNMYGIHELTGRFPQQLWGRPEIERQSKGDQSVGGKRAVSARASMVYPARILQKKGLFRF